MDLNGHGATALHKACEEGDARLVRMLARALSSAEVNALALVSMPAAGRGVSGRARWTPLHFAVKKGALPVVACLLFAGDAQGCRGGVCGVCVVVCGASGRDFGRGPEAAGRTTMGALHRKCV